MAVNIQGLAPLLQVFDMPSSVRFCCDVIGFELLSKSRTGDHFDWALLRLNGVELMLNTAYEEDMRQPGPDPARVASHSDTGLFFGCPDVEEVYRHFLAKGLRVKEPIIQGYGMKQLYVSDLDGYNLCFQRPV